MRSYQNANCCCYCKIILISQMQPANFCCYIARLDEKWILQIAAANARWYQKCILQIAAAIVRLYQKCLLQIATFTKCCCHCKAPSNLHIRNYSWNSKKYFESQCHLNSIPCSPSVRSTKEQRLLQCSNIFTIYIYIFSSYNTKFWLFWFQVTKGNTLIKWLLQG